MTKNQLAVQTANLKLISSRNRRRSTNYRYHLPPRWGRGNVRLLKPRRYPNRRKDFINLLLCRELLRKSLPSSKDSSFRWTCASSLSKNSNIQSPVLARISYISIILLRRRRGWQTSSLLLISSFLSPKLLLLQLLRRLALIVAAVATHPQCPSSHSNHTTPLRTNNSWGSSLQWLIGSEVLRIWWV